MENKNEIIINDTTVIKPKKVYKPLTEAQKEAKKIAMKRCYERKKTHPEYIERQRLSSRTHDDRCAIPRNYLPASPRVPPMVLATIGLEPLEPPRTP